MVCPFLRGVLIPLLLFALEYAPLSIIQDGKDLALTMAISFFLLLPLFGVPIYLMLKSAQRNDDPLFRWIFNKKYLGINLLGKSEKNVRNLVQFKKENEKLKEEIKDKMDSKKVS